MGVTNAKKLPRMVWECVHLPREEGHSLADSVAWMEIKISLGQQDTRGVL